jgi:NAD(P)-dependent dehydrogenase (short-subunit alcohol dehydrogenase family)
VPLRDTEKKATSNEMAFTLEGSSEGHIFAKLYSRSRTPMGREPLGRLGKPDDVASAALFRASN